MNSLHDVTFAKLKDGKRECKYSVYDYHEWEGVDYYTIRRVSSEELEEIKTVTYDKVQALLNKYI